MRLYFDLSKTLDTINQRFFWNKTVFGFSNDNRMSVIGEKKNEMDPRRCEEAKKSYRPEISRKEIRTSSRNGSIEPK